MIGGRHFGFWLAGNLPDVGDGNREGPWSQGAPSGPPQHRGRGHCANAPGYPRSQARPGNLMRRRLNGSSVTARRRQWLELLKQLLCRLPAIRRTLGEAAHDHRRKDRWDGGTVGADRVGRLGHMRGKNLL